MLYRSSAKICPLVCLGELERVGGGGRVRLCPPLDPPLTTTYSYGSDHIELSFAYSEIICSNFFHDIPLFDFQNHILYYASNEMKKL